LITPLKEVRVKRGEHKSFVLQLKNGYDVPVPIDSLHEPMLGYGIKRNAENFPAVKSELSLKKAIDRRIISMEVVMPDKLGIFELKFCVFAGMLPPTHNSQGVKIVVEE
jgi:hypothetical protein